MDEYLQGIDTKRRRKASGAAVHPAEVTQTDREAKPATDITKIAVSKQYQVHWRSGLPEEKQKQPSSSKIGGQANANGEGNRGDATEKSEQQKDGAARAPSFPENQQNHLIGKNISATSNCSRMGNCPNSIKFLFLMNSSEESSVMKARVSHNNCEPIWSKHIPHTADAGSEPENFVFSTSI